MYPASIQWGWFKPIISCGGAGEIVIAWGVNEKGMGYSRKRKTILSSSKKCRESFSHRNPVAEARL
jgi:hypothetical protein